MAVIGERADRVAEPDAWAHIAGLTVGQDISDRDLQFAAGGAVLARQVPTGVRPDGPVGGGVRRGRRSG